MWKSATSHISDSHDTKRSCTDKTTTSAAALTTTLLTAQTSPSSPPPPSSWSSSSSSSSNSSSASTTPFLASRSEIRFALDSNFALQSALLSLDDDEKPPPTPAHPDPIRFSLLPLNHDHHHPDLFFLDGANKETYQKQRQKEKKKKRSPTVHLSPNPNECYRLRQIQLPSHPARCEDDGRSIPLKGGYVGVGLGVTVPASADESDSHDDHYDDDDDDGDLWHEPPPSHPTASLSGFQADDDDSGGGGFSSSVRRFGWGLVRGVIASARETVRGARGGGGGDGKALLGGCQMDGCSVLKSAE